MTFKQSERYKQVKLTIPLYLYVRKICEARYGAGRSTPYYIYLMTKEISRKRK